jgi:hypothetical protein
MKLSDLHLSPGNHFIAMEYYGLILNRTFLILLVESNFIGIVANGLISVKNNSDPLNAFVTNRLAVSGDLYDPHSYLNNNYLMKMEGVNLLTDDLTKIRRANFRYSIDAIADIKYDARKKWGMGNYPHDGRIYMKLSSKRREFIILGNQSGQAIANRIQSRVSSL